VHVEVREKITKSRTGVYVTYGGQSLRGLISMFGYGVVVNGRLSLFVGWLNYWQEDRRLPVWLSHARLFLKPLTSHNWTMRGRDVVYVVHRECVGSLQFY